MGQQILTRIEERVATITINRPEAKNALNLEIEKNLLDTLEQLKSEEVVRVIVLEGAGSTFSAGGDLAEIGGDIGAPQWYKGLKEISFKLIQTMREMPLPIICKVRGSAVGYGMSVALAGDFVVASQKARFCLPFANIGLTVDGCAGYLLPRLVGMAKARQLAFLGEVISGQAAAKMGLIYKAVLDEELDDEVASLARAMAAKPSRLAVATIKESLEGSFERSLQETVDWEASHQAIIIQSAEFKEMVQQLIKSLRKG